MESEKRTNTRVVKRGGGKDREAERIRGFSEKVNSLNQQEISKFVYENIDEFINIWKPSIEKIHNKYCKFNRIIDLSDLEQESVVIALECLGRFDPLKIKKGTNYSKLTNFVITSIHFKLLSYIYHNRFSIHIPAGSSRGLTETIKQKYSPTASGLNNVASNSIDLDSIIYSQELVDKIALFDKDGIFTLHYFYGFTQNEIASALNLTRQTVYCRLSIIKNKIKNRIKNTME